MSKVDECNYRMCDFNILYKCTKKHISLDGYAVCSSITINGVKQ